MSTLSIPSFSYYTIGSSTTGIYRRCVRRSPRFGLSFYPFEVPVRTSLTGVVGLTVKIRRVPLWYLKDVLDLLLRVLRHQFEMGGRRDLAEET